MNKMYLYNIVITNTKPIQSFVQALTKYELSLVQLRT